MCIYLQTSRVVLLTSGHSCRASQYSQTSMFSCFAKTCVVCFVRKGNMHANTLLPILQYAVLLVYFDI